MLGPVALPFALEAIRHDSSPKFRFRRLPACLLISLASSLRVVRHSHRFTWLLFHLFSRFLPWSGEKIPQGSHCTENLFCIAEPEETMQKIVIGRSEFRDR